MSELRIGDLCARIPVIQGGMGVGVSLSGLASAVARAGGIGIISTAQIGFKEGVMTVDSVMEAQTAWLKANSECVDAQIDVQLSYTYLQKVYGTLY